MALLRSKLGTVKEKEKEKVLRLIINKSWESKNVDECQSVGCIVENWKERKNRKKSKNHGERAYLRDVGRAL